MKNSWLPPETSAFERLNVRDGLLIDAHKWQLEQRYVRKRQNYHFQSLNQAGIVSGLEVNITTPPADVRPEHRTGRWIELSQGVALDHQGNIIVVPNPTKYYVNAIVSSQKKSETVYLVLRYRDPDDLQTNDYKEIVTEQFRLDEKVSPPNIGDVEICRIELSSSEVELKPASDVFAPDLNTIDLRYRQFAHWRAQGVVKTAIYNSSESQENGLFFLLKSLRALYPLLEGDNYIDDCFLIPEEETEILSYDLLYLTESQFCSLELLQIKQIQKFVSAGGTILIDATVKDSQLAQLEQSKQELLQAIAKISQISAFANRQQELENELSQINQNFTDKFQNIQDKLSKIGFNLQKWDDLPSEHPLKLEPFFFIQPPIINQYQNQIWACDGVILLLGNLSHAWALSPQLDLTREILRNAQEMGVNLLHYAWRRKLLHSWQKSQPISSLAPTAPTKGQSSEITSQSPQKVSEPMAETEVALEPSSEDSQKRKRPKPSDLL